MSAALAQHVSVEIENRVATVVLDQPPLNILDLATSDELASAFHGLAQRDDLQAVFLRGGGKCFSAGVSIHDHTPDKIAPMLAGFHGVLRQLYGLDTPTVAVVHGHCLGGGMELAAACDMILASDDSRFGQPEVELGCYPPAAAALYPSLLGSSRTFDLLLTGRVIDCVEAEGMGFVTRRAPAGELEAMVEKLKRELTSKSAAVLRLTKRAIRAGRGRQFSLALAETERLYLEELAATEDMAEGVEAFLEKRPPAWRHR